eukprot:jgi/Astpho2/9609/e_gw1.00146.72.1_t
MTHGPCNCVPHVSLWKVLATRALDACTCRWCSHALDTWALEITCPHGPSGVVSVSGTDAVHSCRPAAARPLCPSCRALRMMVLPLVAGCIAGAVCSLREAGTSMGSIATWTLSLFLGLTFCAALLGVVLGAIARPGRGRPFELGGQSSGCLALTTVPAPPKSPLEAVIELLRSMVPDNIVGAAADMNVLGVMMVSLAFGLALSGMTSEEGADNAMQAIEIFNRAVSAIISVSPIGIASLIAANICKAPDLLRTLSSLGLFIATYLVGLLVLACVIQPATMWVLTRQNPVTVYRAFADAMVTVFGTSSSMATLPVTLKSAADYGISESLANFILPLGANCNMHGTAMFQSLAAIFIAQAHGVELQPFQYVVIWLCAALAAVSAAAIPSAGLVNLVLVLQAVSLDQYSGDIAIIFALDWALDRCR